MRMVRTPKWKLIRFHFTNNLNELYDLEADPGETTNLYYRNRFQLNPQYSQIVEQLEQRLIQWQHSIQDPLLRPEYTPLEPLNKRPGQASASKPR